MIELTEQQRHAAHEHRGRPLRLVDPDTQEAYVLMNQELYQRLLAYDDSPWTDEEMDLLAAEDADSLGWEGMDVYQDDKQ